MYAAVLNLKTLSSQLLLAPPTEDGREKDDPASENMGEAGVGDGLRFVSFEGRGWVGVWRL